MPLYIYIVYEETMSFRQFSSDDIIILSLQDIFEHQDILMEIYNSTDEIPSTEETMSFF